MLMDDIRSIGGSDDEVRKFGLLVAALLGLASAYPLWNDRPGYFLLAVLSAAFLAASFAVPEVLKPLQRAWMSLAVVMGWVMTRAVLCALFYLLVTPLAVAARLCGQDFLSLRAARKSYWFERGSGRRDKARYERQF